MLRPSRPIHHMRHKLLLFSMMKKGLYNNINDIVHPFTASEVEEAAHCVKKSQEMSHHQEGGLLGFWPQQQCTFIRTGRDVTYPCWEAGRGIFSSGLIKFPSSQCGRCQWASIKSIWACTRTSGAFLCVCYGGVQHHTYHVHITHRSACTHALHTQT